MKKLLLILLCVPLLFSCGENEEKYNTDNTKDNKENDLTRENIKGDVKQIIVTSFNAKEAFGEPQKGDLSGKTILKYNEDGNQTELTSYRNGDIFSMIKYQYDEDGNETGDISYNFYGEISGKGKYQYDENGIKTGYTYYNTDGKLSSRFFQYDEDGNMIEESKYNSDGELTSLSKYQYDKDRNKTETTSYYTNEVFIYKYKYQYDEDGNMIEERVNEVGYYDSTDVVLLDEGSGNVQVILSDFIITADGEQVRKYKYQYDEDGNKTEYTFYNTYGEVRKYKYQYEFDKINNYITYIQYQDGKPIKIYEREIEYYVYMPFKKRITK